MSTNISKQRRDGLIAKLAAIRAFIATAPQDENTGALLVYISELEKELKAKKYGLVFEEHCEGIDLKLAESTPILSEETDLFIDNGGQLHFLIEGDNLAALQLLLKTHRGKVDVVYIDPPYNTGKKDFVYDDAYVDAEDGFRHSKWLSFMQKRLTLIKGLMNQNSYICISIDNNEQANLKMLCDSVFGESNLIACIPRRTKSSGKTTNKISSNHDYLIIYAVNAASANIGGLDHIDKGFKYEDEFVETRGRYKLNQTLDYDSLQYSDSLDYPLEIEGEVFYPGSSYDKHILRKQGQHNRADWAWRWSKDLVEFGYKNGFIVVKRKKNGTARIYTKTYLNASIVKGSNGYRIEIVSRKKPLSSLEFTEAAYSNDNAKKDLSKLFDNFTFDYPKPVALIDKLLRVNPRDDIVVLDCFAGTGTTGQAVLELNQEGGSRRFILCTNNENNICREVTFERIKRVIARGGYAASMKYYKVDYVPVADHVYYEYADEILRHVRELVELENGINFTGNAEIAIVLTDEEMEAFLANVEQYAACKRLYRGHDILLSAEQEALLAAREITVCVIPDYYYRDLEGGR